MQRLISFLAIIMVLTACQPFVESKPATSTAIPTATVEVLPTSTTAPTQIPATPTATSDPNMPKSATGKNANNNWIKPLLDANGNLLKDHLGNQVYATWETYPVGINGQTITGWFVNHIRNGINIPIVDAINLLKAGMPMHFMVKEKIVAKYLEHKPNTGADPGVDYLGNVQALLESRYYEKPFHQISTSEGMDFLTTIFPNNFAKPVTDAQGNSHTIYGDESFTVVLADPSDIPNPDFVIPNDSGPATSILSATIFDDEHRSVTILVANTKPYPLSDQDLIGTILRPLGHDIVFADLSQKAWKNALYSQIGNADSFAYMALKGTPSYFTLSDLP